MSGLKSESKTLEAVAQFLTLPQQIYAIHIHSIITETSRQISSFLQAYPLRHEARLWSLNSWLHKGLYPKIVPEGSLNFFYISKSSLYIEIWDWRLKFGMISDMLKKRPEELTGVKVCNIACDGNGGGGGLKGGGLYRAVCWATGLGSIIAVGTLSWAS